MKDDWNLGEFKEYNQTIGKVTKTILIYWVTFQVGALLISQFMVNHAWLSGGNVATVENSGLPYFGAVAISLFFVWTYVSPQLQKKILAPGRVKMTKFSFFTLVVTFILIQLLLGIFDSVIEMVLNLFGYSALEQLKQAVSLGTTWSMLAYSALLAPISEELVFRGYLLRSLEKYGAKLAIVVSAAMFGLMHANIMQTPFAFCVGLILGYVAYNYGIVWSIVLHFCNNFVISGVSDFLNNHWGNFGQYINLVINLAACVCALVLLYSERQTIKDWLAQNKIRPGYIERAIFNLPMLLFIIVITMVMFAGLTTINMMH